MFRQTKCCLCSLLIRHNPHLIPDNLANDNIDDLTDEELRKQLLQLDEDQHDEKREALAVFNNKVINCMS